MIVLHGVCYESIVKQTEKNADKINELNTKEDKHTREKKEIWTKN